MIEFSLPSVAPFSMTLLKIDLSKSCREREPDADGDRSDEKDDLEGGMVAVDWGRHSPRESPRQRRR
ncbi:hypothetical protein [Halobacterium sp. KA-6]|uniref:hypothetical protein n=1 Tax=Halobacterium sp. KA-6 TaxID=2896368 RepID=UPI001E5F7FDC|nr:hypothetical protein [Halobacterium sp. KA-6]MCD2204429.1 hypothetical protein [Halobacterium sp. KA-6]